MKKKSATGVAVNNSAAVKNTNNAQALEAALKRIGDLVSRREDWEKNEYNRSNQALYGVIADCLHLYLDLTTGSNIKSIKDGLTSYIKDKGYRFKASSPLTLKVIRCVFGERDRRRLSTYHTVLCVAIAEKWALGDVAKNIGDCGGVQEISLRKPDGMSASYNADAARAALMSQSIATLSSDAISKQFNTDDIGNNAVAVLTLTGNGSYSVHCVVKSATAVNTALARYFSANKDVIVELQKQQKAQAAEAEKVRLISDAANAANDAAILLSA